MQPPVTILNPPSHHPDQRTIVIFGVYRGGTSMLAGLARLFGIFMGDQICGPNNEDLDLQGASGDYLDQMIQTRNAQHDIWGWKDPGLLHTLADCYPRLRNPYFIVSFRDILASAQTQVHGGFHPNMVESLRLTQDHVSKLVDFVAIAEAQSLPLMLVSYERALHDKAGVIEEMARFVGIEIDDSIREEALGFVDPQRGYGPPPRLASQSLPNAHSRFPRVHHAS